MYALVWSQALWQLTLAPMTSMCGDVRNLSPSVKKQWQAASFFKRKAHFVTINELYGDYRSSLSYCPSLSMMSFSHVADREGSGCFFRPDRGETLALPFCYLPLMGQPLVYAGTD